MAWIESHQGLGKHPKTLKAARLLGVDKVTLVGHLHYLWWWALDNAEDGNLRGLAAEEIAVAAEWSGDANLFVDAIHGAGREDQAGFLEGTPGNLVIHDFLEHTAKLRESRRQYQEAKVAGGKARAANAIREGGRFTSSTPAAHQQTVPAKLDQQDQQDQLTVTMTVTNTNHIPSQQHTLIAPAGASVREEMPEKPAERALTAEFDAFKDAYPKRCTRINWAKAQIAWKKHKPPIEEVLAALAWQDAEYSDWQRTNIKGEYDVIEAPSVWINQHNWERVKPQKPGAPPTTSQANPKGILEGVAHLQARRRVGDGPDDWENWYEMIAAEDAEVAF